MVSLFAPFVSAADTDSTLQIGLQTVRLTVTEEQAVEGNPFVLSIAGKKSGEQVLHFAEKHPYQLLCANNANHNCSPNMLDMRDVAVLGPWHEA
jgi:hypothetical protein